MAHFQSFGREKSEIDFSLEWHKRTQWSRNRVSGRGRWLQRAGAPLPPLLPTTFFQKFSKKNLGPYTTFVRCRVSRPERSLSVAIGSRERTGLGLVWENVTRVRMKLGQWRSYLLYQEKPPVSLAGRGGLVYKMDIFQP